jgi:HlyD family secretion protein
VSPDPRKPRPNLHASAGTSERLQSREDYGLVEITDGSDAREFLLAERPRLMRATIWLSLLLLAALIGWSCVGTVDVTISAPGVVRPRGNLVQVQSPVNGVVTEVLIREGATVNEHDVILRFDPKPLRDERALIEERVNAKRTERAEAEESRRRLARSYEADQQAFQVEVSAAEKQIELEKVNRDYQVRVAKGKLEEVRAELETLGSRIEIQEETVARTRQQFQGGAKTQDQLDAEERQLRTLRAELEPKRRDIEVAKLACEPNETHVQIAENALEKTRTLLAKEKASYEIKDGEAEARITQIDGEIHALQKEVAVVDGKLERVELRAPVAGLVTRLAVTFRGTVVPEGSTVAEISPSGRDLVLEAYVRNTDRGEVRVGKGAKIRFAAFPYQEYGALDGEVTDVAPDSMKMPTDAPAGALADGPVYKVTVSMSRLQLENNRRQVGVVQLGMAAEADIVVKESPLIFLVLNEIRDFFDLRRR